MEVCVTNRCADFEECVNLTFPRGLESSPSGAIRNDPRVTKYLKAHDLDINRGGYVWAKKCEFQVIIYICLCAKDVLMKETMANRVNTRVHW